MTSNNSLNQVDEPSPQLKFTIRDYGPGDSIPLINFSNRVEDYKSFGGLLHIGRNYPNTYHSHMERYKKSYILIAEDKDIILGSIELAMKEVYLHQQKQIVGYIFGMKLDPTVKESEIGPQLLNQIEEKARKEGAILVYKMLYGDDENEKKFYEDHGYDASGKRIINIYQMKNQGDLIVSKMIGNPQIKSVFQEISVDIAKILTKEFYEKEDFLPTNIDELFKTDDYVGTYTAETVDGKNIAGVSLFLEPKDYTFGLKKLIMKTNDFSRQNYHIINFSLLSLIPAGLYYTLNCTLQVKPSISAILAIGLNIGIMFGYLKIIKFGRMFSIHEKRGKYIGFFYNGEEKYQKDLMDMLFSNCNRIAHSKGFRSITFNVDMKDRYLKYYPVGMRFQNILLHKLLQTNSNWNGLSNNLLLDPRDP